MASEYPNHWQFKKARIESLKKTGGKCGVCGNTADVVHHIDGSKTNHEIDNLVPLCDSCHWAAHAEEFRIINGKPMKTKRPSTTSVFRRIYGHTVDELASIVGRSHSFVFNLHYDDPKRLKKMILESENKVRP